MTDGFLRAFLPGKGVGSRPNRHLSVCNWLKGCLPLGLAQLSGLFCGRWTC